MTRINRGEHNVFVGNTPCYRDKSIRLFRFSIKRFFDILCPSQGNIIINIIFSWVFQIKNIIKHQRIFASVSRWSHWSRCSLCAYHVSCKTKSLSSCCCKTVNKTIRIRRRIGEQHKFFSFDRGSIKLFQWKSHIVSITFWRIYYKFRVI